MTRPFMFSVSWFDSDAGKKADELYVTSFSGTEEIARPYEIELNLISRSAPQDFRNILKRRCQLSIRRQVQSVDADSISHTQRLIHGMVSSFELRGFDGTSYQYRTVLVPRLWRATQAELSRVFVDTALWDVLQASWSDVPGVDVATEHDRVSNMNPTRKFTMQYRESSLNFLSRWLEFYGIAYYFKQEEDGEIAVFTNAKEGFLPLATGDENRLPFIAEGRAASEREYVRSVYWRNILVPKTLTMADYNIDEPTKPKRAVVDISTPGTGDHVQIDSDTTTFDVEDVLDVRKDEYLGAEYRVFGESNVRALAAGYTIRIRDNPVDSAETEYLVVRVTHKGEQSVDVDSGRAKGARYENSYEAIPNSITYRPPNITPRPQVAGFVHGVVENPDGAQYPGIDDNGYYRVRLFFDNDSTLNNASCAIRKMEPFGGPDRGMHMPLINGTEVVVGFLGGDPDQPFIAGALPGPSQTSPVVSSNRDQTIIKTKATRIVMQDLEGEESITLSNTGTFAGNNLSVLTDASLQVGNSTKSFSNIAAMAAMSTDISLISKVIQGIVAVSIASMRGITIMAGYKKIQVAIAALMTTLTIAYKYESDAKRSGSQPAAIANIVMPIVNLVFTIGIVATQLQLLKREVAKDLKIKMTPRSIVWPQRAKRLLLSSNWLSVAASKVATFFVTLFTMKSFTEAYNRASDLKDNESEIHGISLVRAGDGNALGVQGTGKSILIATDGGSIDLVAEKDFTVHGNYVLQTAETGAMIIAMGKPTQEIGSAISIDMNTAALMGPGELPAGTLRIGKDWLSMGHKVHGSYSPTKHGTGMVMKDGEMTITSKLLSIGTNDSKVAMAIGEEFGVYLMGKNAAGVVLDSMGGKVTLTSAGIVVEDKSGKGIKIQSMGEITIASGKGVTISGTKVSIGGGSVAIEGGSLKVNGQAIGAVAGKPPKPPVIKPPLPAPPAPPVVPSGPAMNDATIGIADKNALARMSSVLKWITTMAKHAPKS